MQKSETISRSPGSRSPQKAANLESKLKNKLNHRQIAFDKFKSASTKEMTLKKFLKRLSKRLAGSDLSLKPDVLLREVATICSLDPII